MIEEKKLQAAEKSLIEATYLHQQYNSPRCWKTAEQALNEYCKLRTKAEKLRHVKEQILIRYLGLGWVEAHHNWSSKG